MQNLKIKIGIFILIVFIGGTITILVRSPKLNSVVTTPDTATPTEKTYSMSEVTSHGTAQSCWTTIRGNVYDLTSWIDKHPGGREAILSLCGKDGTTAFVNQHGGQKNPEAELKILFIGGLKK